MLVLASSSPRRAMLLEEGGFSFIPLKIEVSEELPLEIEPATGVKELALRKAVAGCQAWLESGGSSEDVILGADTIVVIDSQILGKPNDPEDAVKMLQQLSGRQHEVYTGVALVNGKGRQENQAIQTKVYFRSLSLQEIQAYVASGEPMDKAGAYAIQGGAGKFVDYFKGSFSNVIGLPMEYIGERLSAWGVEHENIILREVKDGLPPFKGSSGGIVAP